MRLELILLILIFTTFITGCINLNFNPKPEDLLVFIQNFNWETIDKQTINVEKEELKIVFNDIQSSPIRFSFNSTEKIDFLFVSKNALDEKISNRSNISVKVNYHDIPKLEDCSVSGEQKVEIKQCKNIPLHYSIIVANLGNNTAKIDFKIEKKTQLS